MHLAVGEARGGVVVALVVRLGLVQALVLELLVPLALAVIVPTLATRL
jgi:hypothetical protein